jgi:hypothetical protein
LWRISWNDAQMLQDVEGVLWFSLESENYESIHNHSAYAQLEMDLRINRGFSDRLIKVSLNRFYGLRVVVHDVENQTERHSGYRWP